MRDLGTRLRDVDPLRHEPGPATADLRVMRQTVVGAARMSGARRVAWETLVIATVVALTLAAAIRFDKRHSANDDKERGSADPSSTGARRQLQFATPGGTRVIWVFDAGFQP